MASAFPPKYTQAMMAGQGLAGLVVALAAMFTTLAGPDDTSCTASAATISGATNKLDRLKTADAYSAAQLFTSSACSSYSVDWSTLVYFTIAVAVLLGCIATYPVLERLPLTTFYMQPCGVNASQGGEVTICSAAKTGDSHHRHSCGQNSIPRSGNCASVTEIGQLDSMHHRLVEQRSPSRSPRPLLSPGKPLSDGNTVLWDQDDCEGGEESGSAGARNGTVTGDGARPMLRIRSKLAPIAEYAFAVFMVFAVTLSIFPGATSEIVSSRRCLPGRARFFSDDIFMLFSFVSFNTFDFLGRLAAGAKSVIAPKHLPHAAVMRLVFVPLFLACRSENSRLSQWLSADAFPLMLMPVFAMTSGYVGSLSMMAGSQKGPFAGTAMVLSLSAGLLAGSLLSFVVLFVTTGKMI